MAINIVKYPMDIALTFSVYILVFVSICSGETSTRVQIERASDEIGSNSYSGGCNDIHNSDECGNVTHCYVRNVLFACVFIMTNLYNLINVTLLQRTSTNR